MPDIEYLIDQRAREIYNETRRVGWDPSYVNASWVDRANCERLARYELAPGTIPDKEHDPHG